MQEEGSMGTFERLSVLVIGVILVMILVVAVVTWTDDPVPCVIEKAELDEPAEKPIVGEQPIRIARPEDPLVDPAPPPDPVPAPVPTPEPAPKPAPEPKQVEQPGLPTPRIHIVQKGESLIGIARLYYPSPKFFPEIMRANGLETPLIRPGQELTIPPAGVLGLENEPDKIHNQPSVPLQATPVPGQPYAVRRGEDLPAIAKGAYNDVERWPEIWIANRRTIPDPKAKLKEGTVLQIP